MRLQALANRQGYTQPSSRDGSGSKQGLPSPKRLWRRPMPLELCGHPPSQPGCKSKKRFTIPFSSPLRYLFCLCFVCAFHIRALRDSINIRFPCHIHPSHPRQRQETDAHRAARAHAQHSAVPGSLSRYIRITLRSHSTRLCTHSIQSSQFLPIPLPLPSSPLYFLAARPGG